MNEKIRKIIQDIKQLKIQGARNIAKKALEAIIYTIKTSKAKNKDELLKEITTIADKLLEARPTEPMVFNEMEELIRFAIMQIRTYPSMNIKTLKKILIKESKEYEEEWIKNKMRLATHGSRLIQNGMTILTYCHSSSVMSVLKRAYDEGKKFEVVCFETRPLFQGRISAKELSSYGIKTTLVVDGAMNLYMKKANLVLVGADAITAVGDLINKIGTSTLAHIARMHDVSFYSCAEIFKYEPLTLYGKRVEIEKRNKKEIWDDAPSYLQIENYAFDVTPARYINGYITEIGVLPPQSLWSVAAHRMGVDIV
jgi:ribose 1,5-bisphosphate isomerase